MQTMLKMLNKDFTINGVNIPLVISQEGEVFGVHGMSVVNLEGDISNPVIGDKIGDVKGTRGTGETLIYKVIVELK